jgi:3-isopropylmalate/(R)-2-methylmalate dehydratase large subunit
MSRTLLDKIWDAHVIDEGDDDEFLLYIDLTFLHDGAYDAFLALRAANRPVRRPRQTVAVADHYIPTVGQANGADSIADVHIRKLLAVQASSCKEFDIPLFGLGHRDQGIVHVVGPEQGLSRPGLTITCCDSHTTTHGALGAFAFGVGISELTHALATQTIWRRKPGVFQVRVDGELRPWVTAKDVALALIRRIGAAGASEHVVEFAGSTVEAMSIEQRMTLCNMTIEAGGRAGMVAPDAKTFDYLRGRPYSPTGDGWRRAVDDWTALRSDPGCHFDKTVELRAESIEPHVTWGTSAEDALPISATVPDPDDVEDPARAARIRKALTYMDLRPGTPLRHIAVDSVFIGSCTNSRIEDLRDAARVVEGRRAVVPAIVVPGSGPVRRQAETEGLADVFRDAGFEWREPGCSLCIAANGESVARERRCASTSNRNFEGRQGAGARTHLMSPAMAAAAAITGRLTDVREVAR